MIPPECEWDPVLQENYFNIHSIITDSETHNKLVNYEKICDKILSDVSSNKYSYLLFLAVNPLYRNQGYGKIMINECIKETNFIIIDTTDSNLINYYIKLGFKICGADKITSNISTTILKYD